MYKSILNYYELCNRQMQKRPKQSLFGASASILELYYVFSLWSAVALHDVEFYALAFVQRFVAVSNDCAEVYEYVATAFNFDKTEALF